MKNKSVRHKEFNTFKFQTFEERISNIDIDIFHKVGHENENLDEENVCFFYQSIEKWNLLNLTEGYNEFKRELQPHNIRNVKDIIENKDKIIELLLKYLKLKNPLYLQPLLENLVALARDLHKDFYPYYQQVFTTLIDVLHTKDTEQLEWTFTCLAYLFKFLWRFIIKDISNVFNSILPLLSNTKPIYINNFAAESFAFVTRKIRDRKFFLEHILKVVETKNDGIEGCGKLLFKVIHGITNEFHSCSENFLLFLIESLFDDQLPRLLLFKILQCVVKNICENIKTEKCQLLFNILLVSVKNCVNKLSSSTDSCIYEYLNLILQLLEQCIKYKNGKLLQKSDLIVKEISILLQIENFPNKLYLTLTNITILLLLNKNIQLSQEQSSNLIKKVLLLNEKSIFLHFIDNICEFSLFEPLILPEFLNYCVKCEFNNCIKLLTKIIIKKTENCESGLKLYKWRQYLIDFKNNNKYAEEYFLNYLKISGENFDIDNLICCFICLSNMNLIDKLKIIIELTNLLNKIINLENISLLKKLFILNYLIQCLVHINSKKCLIEQFNVILNLTLPLAINPKFIISLKIINLLISALKDEDEIICEENLEKIHSTLNINFYSPYHKIRLLTSHIYTFFENLKLFQLNYSNDPNIIPNEKFSVFTIIFHTESIESNVNTYRDQLKNLENFNFNKPQIIMCNQTIYSTIPLQYLCGVFYINFNLLWNSIMNIIESYAHNMEINKFWNIFGNKLKNASENIINPIHFEIEKLDINWDFLNNLFNNSHLINLKIDFINYRNLLWKCMELFPDIVEIKTKDVIEIFFNFIDNEFIKNHSNIALTWNIKQKSFENLNDNINNSSIDSKIHDEINNSLDDIDVTNPNNSDELDRNNIIIINNRDHLYKIYPQTINKKAHIQLLLNCLSVFSKVRSPKSMYREPDLYRLYFDFLQYKNTNIQKLAFDCIKAYKHKYLIPYQNNLYNLIDNKNFKKELINFRIDTESNIILNEHRNDLMPIVMNIVYSKMTTKIGLRTGGKSSGQQRRNLILRFLAGCQKDEMFKFIHMNFKIFTKYFEYNLTNLSDNIDLENFIPPKRLQSTINLLNVIFEQFGGLMADDLLTFLLKIILIIGALIKGAIENISLIHSGYYAILKNIKTSSIKLIEKFFTRFDHYPWNNEQINLIFDIFIWPYLNKLNIEGIHSPTILLKLFVEWGSNPRYFPLLIKYENTNKNQFVLNHVINLFINNKSHFTVINLIEEMFEKMLSLEINEDEKKLTISIDNLLPLSNDILNQKNLNNKLNYGSCILLPHVPLILKKFKQKLENKSKNLNQKELFILSRISELVWEKDVSNEILKLLLPIILKRCINTINEEILLQLLTTINNLINNLTNPIDHLKQIIPLFGVINYISGRKLLIEILKKIYQNNLNDIIIIINLNSWDKKWIDQPDFEKRHDTFKNIQKIIETIKLDLGILLIYNFYYFLKNEKDLSIRENSSYCLKLLSIHLLRNYSNLKDLNYILNETIYPLIIDGMKKNHHQDFRNECISLLGHLARECPESHFILNDLNKYSCKNDLDVDLFENIIHLQHHRHARALIKFTQITKELKLLPNKRTLTQFILPLATYYLCNEKYTDKNTIIDAAIECIGTICHLLSWHQYEGLLKFYLSKLRFKLDYQKQIIKLIVVILDAFHYDLTKAYVIIEENSNDNNDSNIKLNEEEIEEKSDDLFLDDINNDDIEIEDGDDDTNNIKIENEMIQFKILCKSTATRVINSIQYVLLPQLHKSLGEMTYEDSSHKINRKKMGILKEEEELIRVPISLALVKLLQKLPKSILEANLPGIFMKICSFLKSHLESVRRITRETLQKIMQTLGPQYLPDLLREMTPLLKRGFHAHVLVYTVHAILNCLKEMYTPRDIDKVLLTVLDLCKIDLFGNLSEEKEIIKIGIKTSEAKSSKSIDTLQILAEFCTEQCLMDLLIPLKDILQSSYSHKIIYKIDECLRHICLGFVDNKFITVDNLLKFSYGIISNSIPDLITTINNKSIQSINDKEKLQRLRTDCFILPPNPVRASEKYNNNIKITSTTNSHLIIGFGLRLCYFILKRDKLENNDYFKFMDPFIELFKNCLTSKHIKLTTLCFNILCYLIKYELPKIKLYIDVFINEIFSILHKYASAGLNKGDNFDLVLTTFKLMSIILRDVDYYIINTDQLKILLLYVEHDMHDNNRQAIAFNLLKSILTRKLIIPEIHDVMVKVAELSIISELHNVRIQAKIVFHQYFMNYPLGKKLESYLSFFINQLEYEMEYGREAAIEIIDTMIKSFPRSVLKSRCGSLMIPIGARLVNEETPSLRKMIADCLISMLNRLNKKERNPLFDVLILWFKSNNVSHRELAAQICGLFVLVEKSSFESRLTILIPIIMRQFNPDTKPGRFVRIKKDNIGNNEELQKQHDHHIFQVLQMLLKISIQCPSFFKMEQIEDIENHIQYLLGHPHDWIRLAACQFLGFILSSINIDKLISLILTNSNDQPGYLYRNPLDSLKSLTLDLCDQLQPDVKSDLAEQTVKNLVFVAKVLQKINITNKINLFWLVKKVRKIIYTEIIETPTSITLRNELFKWIAGVGTILDLDKLLLIFNHLLAPLLREMLTTDETNAPLRQLAKEVSILLKNRVGIDEYTKSLSKLQQTLTIKRAERKRKRTQLAITDPEIYAKKKIKRNEKKKEIRKKKIATMKGKKILSKKRKLIDLEPESEVV